MRFSSTLAAVLMSSCLLNAAQAGKLYKWVDDKGRIHYSDKIPPQDVHRPHNYMDKRGLVVESVDAAKTDEEIRQEAELARLRQERQRLIEKQQKEDRVLLRTFRSEEDIILTRDGQIQAIDAYIKVNRGNIKRLKLKLEDLQRQAAARELSGKQVSKFLKDEIAAKNTALKESYQSIVNREHDKDRIRKSFAKDQNRFRELRRLVENNDPMQEAEDTLLEALKNVYDCGPDDLCEAPWKQAKSYMQQYATTPVKMAADNILMSGAPVEEDDLSITLSRIRDPNSGHTLIFLDLQCKESPQGIRTCQSDAVQAIKQGFQTALSQP